MERERGETSEPKDPTASYRGSRYTLLQRASKFAVRHEVSLSWKIMRMGTNLLSSFSVLYGSKFVESVRVPRKKMETRNNEIGDFRFLKNRA